MKDTPLVSVLMTAYNREKYIAEAIESVLASTYTNFELIIVDDCSIDNTVAIAKKYASNDNRIRLYVNEQNLAQFPNRNKAAGLANGFLIVNVDSDDTIKPDGLEYLVNAFMENPDVNFATIYGQADIKGPTVQKSQDCVRNHLFTTNHMQVGPGGTVIRTDFFKRIGGFPTDYGPAGDCYYNIKAACNTDVLLLPYIYFNYRIHDNQELNRKYSYLYNNYKYFRDMMQLPELPLSAIEKKRLLQKNVKNFLINCFMYLKNTGELGKTIKALKLAGVKPKEILTSVYIK